MRILTMDVEVDVEQQEISITTNYYDIAPVLNYTGACANSHWKREVQRVKETAIHKALIALGWTPPQGK